MLSRDTIAAIATPPGAGAIGIVRLSGARAGAIGEALFGTLPPPRTAALRTLCDAGGRMLDRVLVLHFPAPGSYTGEPVLELHGHGGTVLLDLVMERLIGLGARPARPGEFSERAFLNGKMDLAQAEAVADLIAGASRSAVRGAARSLQGAFSARVEALAETLLTVRAAVEADLDFPDEDTTPRGAPGVAARLAAAGADLERLLATAARGQLLRDGMEVVLAGAPNAGKSSLLNALAGRERAIVNPAPGTTRDLLDVRVALAGVPLTLVDTAGLREAPGAIEGEGLRRARAAMERADGILLVHDDADPAAPPPATLRAALPPQAPLLLVYNKIDQSGREPGAADAAGAAGEAVAVSALRGTGLAALRTALRRTLGLEDGGEGEGGAFTARRRHLEALQRCRRHLAAAATTLAREEAALELAAEDLRLAHHALGEITGACSSEDLLGRVFATFCIGK